MLGRIDNYKIITVTTLIYRGVPQIINADSLNVVLTSKVKLLNMKDT